MVSQSKSVLKSNGMKFIEGIGVVPDYIFYSDELWADEAPDETPIFPDSLQDAGDIDDWSEVIF
jgi:hypothetical protein